MRAQGIDLYIDTHSDNSSIKLTDYEIIIAIVKQSKELRHSYRWPRAQQLKIRLLF